MRRFLSMLLASVLAASSVLTPIAQANFWGERQKNIQRSTADGATQLAGLPAGFSSNGMGNPQDFLRQLPALGKSLGAFSSPYKRFKLPTSVSPFIEAISLNAGTVKELSINNPKSPLVILIQDVHMNEEAQRNIAAILLALNDKTAALSKHQPMVAGVEGAFGPFDFSRFRSFEDKHLVKAVADYFLKESKFAASSYVGITAATPATSFYGIDDLKHYNANVEAYRSSQALKKSLALALDKEKSGVIEQKRKVLNPELLKFDARRSAYLSGSEGLGDYASYLSRAAEAMGNSDENQELVLEQFLSAYEIEKSLDFQKVERERAQIVETLAAKLTKDDLNQLVADGLAYRMGRISFAGYYKEIKSLIDRHKISLSRAPSFDQYIRYVLLADGIQAEPLMAAVARLEKKVLTGFVRTPEEKKLMDQSRYLYLVGKLLDFALTPEEWEEYKTALPPHASQWGGKEGNKSPFEKFYQEADIRSGRMVSALLSQSSAKNNVSVMVVGGFHTPQLTRLLKEKDVSYAVVQPKITKIDGVSGTEYLSIFTREKTPLDKLFEGEKLFLAPNVLAVGAYHPEDDILSAVLQLLSTGKSGTITCPSGHALAGEIGFSRQPNAKDGEQLIEIPGQPRLLIGPRSLSALDRLRRVPHHLVVSVREFEAYASGWKPSAMLHISLVPFDQVLNLIVLWPHVINVIASAYKKIRAGQQEPKLSQRLTDVRKTLAELGDFPQEFDAAVKESPEIFASDWFLEEFQIVLNNFNNQENRMAALTTIFFYMRLIARTPASRNSEKIDVRIINLCHTVKMLISASIIGGELNEEILGKAIGILNPIVRAGLDPTPFNETFREIIKASGGDSGLLGKALDIEGAELDFFANYLNVWVPLSTLLHVAKDRSWVLDEYARIGRALMSQDPAVNPFYENPIVPYFETMHSIPLALKSAATANGVDNEGLMRDFFGLLDLLIKQNVKDLIYFPAGLTDILSAQNDEEWNALEKKADGFSLSGKINRALRGGLQNLEIRRELSDPKKFQALKRAFADFLKRTPRSFVREDPWLLMEWNQLGALSDKDTDQLYRTAFPDLQKAQGHVAGYDWSVLDNSSLKFSDEALDFGFENSLPDHWWFIPQGDEQDTSAKPEEIAYAPGQLVFSDGKTSERKTIELMILVGAAAESWQAEGESWPNGSPLWRENQLFYAERGYIVKEIGGEKRKVPIRRLLLNASTPGLLQDAAYQEEADDRLVELNPENFDRAEWLTVEPLGFSRDLRTAYFVVNNQIVQMDWNSKPVTGGLSDFRYTDDNRDALQLLQQRLVRTLFEHPYLADESGQGEFQTFVFNFVAAQLELGHSEQLPQSWVDYYGLQQKQENGESVDSDQMMIASASFWDWAKAFSNQIYTMDSIANGTSGERPFQGHAADLLLVSLSPAVFVDFAWKDGLKQRQELEKEKETLLPFDEVMMAVFRASDEGQKPVLVVGFEGTQEESLSFQVFSSKFTGLKQTETRVVKVQSALKTSFRIIHINPTASVSVRKASSTDQNLSHANQRNFTWALTGLSLLLLLSPLIATYFQHITSLHALIPVGLGLVGFGLTKLSFDLRSHLFRVGFLADEVATTHKTPATDARTDFAPEFDRLDAGTQMAVRVHEAWHRVTLQNFPRLVGNPVGGFFDETLAQILGVVFYGLFHFLPRPTSVALHNFVLLLAFRWQYFRSQDSEYSRSRNLQYQWAASDDPGAAAKKYLIELSQPAIQNLGVNNRFMPVPVRQMSPNAFKVALLRGDEPNILQLLRSQIGGEKKSRGIIFLTGDVKRTGDAQKALTGIKAGNPDFVFIDGNPLDLRPEALEELWSSKRGVPLQNAGSPLTISLSEQAMSSLPSAVAHLLEQFPADGTAVSVYKLIEVAQEILAIPLNTQSIEKEEEFQRVLDQMRAAQA